MVPKQVLPRVLIDRRIVDRNIKKGLVSREAFELHLQSLPDMAEQAETIRARLGEGEDVPVDSAEDSTETPG